MKISYLKEKKVYKVISESADSYKLENGNTVPKHDCIEVAWSNLLQKHVSIPS